MQTNILEVPSWFCMLQANVTWWHSTSAQAMAKRQGHMQDLILQQLVPGA